MSIKVIEDMEPLEVMKAAMEGKRIAWLNSAIDPSRWIEWGGAVTLTALAQAVDGGYKIAIIDDSQPEISPYDIESLKDCLEEIKGNIHSLEAQLNAYSK